MRYGERSRFVKAERYISDNKVNMEMHGDMNGFDALTPLDEQTGIITPASLHFVSSHGNAPPDIDPQKHRLMIHGMVDRPLIFTMEELKRLPSVTRIHYIECRANSPRSGEERTRRSAFSAAQRSWCESRSDLGSGGKR
jgi:sulfane dehydrogenase subunit SoxC